MKENELKVFNELKTYKDPAHESIFLMMNLFQSVEEINRQKCYNLGFINSKNVKSWDSITTRKGCKEFVRYYLKVMDTYGKDSVLVTQQEFINLVEKYQLVCGPFSSYTGSIPESQLDRISYAESHLKRGYRKGIHPYYLSCITGIEFKYREDFSRESMYDFLKFPFYEEKFGEKGVNEYDYLKERGFDVRPLKSFLWRTTSNLFIAALSKDMGIDECVHEELNRLNIEEQRRNKELERRRKEFERRVQNDPLICTWIPRMGVIIHTAWGTEASDDLLQQRNVVNNFILEIIKKYNLKFFPF